MKGRAQRIIGALVLALATAMFFTGTGQATRPDDRAGMLGVGAVVYQAPTPSVRPDDRAGLRGPGPRAPQTASPQLKPGLRDFGLSYGRIAVPPASTSGPAAQQQVEIVPSRGFDWRDAGIGAAATLGIVLLVGGLGAGLVLRSHRREFLSA